MVLKKTQNSADPGFQTRYHIPPGPYYRVVGSKVVGNPFLCASIHFQCIKSRLRSMFACIFIGNRSEKNKICTFLLTTVITSSNRIFHHVPERVWGAPCGPKSSKTCGINVSRWVLEVKKKSRQKIPSRKSFRAFWKICPYMVHIGTNPGLQNSSSSLSKISST